MPNQETKTYKVDLLGLTMSIVRAPSIRAARKWALEEFGRLREPEIVRATKEDVEWFIAYRGEINEA